MILRYQLKCFSVIQAKEVKILQSIKCFMISLNLIFLKGIIIVGKKFKKICS